MATNHKKAKDGKAVKPAAPVTPPASATERVTVDLTPAQFGMAVVLADYDGCATLADWFVHELRSSVSAAYECAFHLGSPVAALVRFDGQDQSAIVAQMRREQGAGAPSTELERPHELPTGSLPPEKLQFLHDFTPAQVAFVEKVAAAERATDIGAWIRENFAKMIVGLWCDDLNHDEKAAWAEWNADAAPEVKSGRATVELDDLASDMLQRVCREGTHNQAPGEDPRDLVSAAVTFYLCDGKNDQHGEFDLSSGDEALERAKLDRLALEKEER